jgi:dethiobiotin synthetase
MTPIFVTGTDTGVGKTLVSAAIAAALARRGERVGVVKPVETGCRPDPEDALALAAAAGDTAPLADVCPHQLPDPLAPSLAAERAGITIDVDALVAHVQRRAASADVLLIEGAGGLLVPLTQRASFADFAAQLGARVVLVVGSRLGAINHTLLTLDALAGRKIAVAGYVMNHLEPDEDLAVATNEALLAALTGVGRLGTVPWISDAATLLANLRTPGSTVAEARARLADFGDTLDLATITG